MAGCTIGGKHFFTGCHQCILPFRLIESHHPSPQQSLFFLLKWCNIGSELFIRFLLTGGTTQQHAFRGGRIQERPWENRLFPNLVERSEEHTSELQSLMRISYAVFCLKKKKVTYEK